MVAKATIKVQATVFYPVISQSNARYVNTERILKPESDALLIRLDKCKHKLWGVQLSSEINFLTSEQTLSLRATGYKVPRTR